MNTQTKSNVEINLLTGKKVLIADSLRNTFTISIKNCVNDDLEISFWPTKSPSSISIRTRDPLDKILMDFNAAGLEQPPVTSSIPRSMRDFVVDLAQFIFNRGGPRSEPL